MYQLMVDWLVSSQMASHQDLVGLSHSTVFKIIHQEFPGGLDNAMSHFTALLAA